MRTFVCTADSVQNAAQPLHGTCRHFGTTLPKPVTRVMDRQLWAMLSRSRETGMEWSINRESQHKTNHPSRCASGCGDTGAWVHLPAGGGGGAVSAVYPARVYSGGDPRGLLDVHGRRLGRGRRRIVGWAKLFRPF